MSETKECGNGAFVTEVTVEGYVSDVEVVSTLRKLALGTHQAVTEAFRGKSEDCYVVAKVVTIKRACPLIGVQKVIVREVSPEGLSGDVFALFMMGKVAKHFKNFAVKVDDMLIIHQPHISKSCLINLLNQQSHPYELQVICGWSPESKNIPSSGVFIHLIRLKVPEVVEMVPDVIGTLPGETEKTLDETGKARDEKTLEDNDMASDVTEMALEDNDMAPEETGKVHSVIGMVTGQHTKNSGEEENSHCESGGSVEVTNASATPEKLVRGRKKLLNPDEYNCLKVLPKRLEKRSKRFYMRLGEITPSCTKANIIGVITSVEKACKCMEEKEHLLIHLQDETSSGKNFILNVGCYSSEIPPLHDMYILRAINVLVLFENDVATGWVTKGKLLATVDSDCEKPISLLSFEENCTLSEEDEERIYELRSFVKASLSLGDFSTQSENCSKDVSTAIASVSSEDENSLELHLDSSMGSQHNEMNLSTSKVPEVVEMVPDVIGTLPGETEKTLNETEKAPEDTKIAPGDTEMAHEDNDMAPEETGKVHSVIGMVPGQHTKNSGEEENSHCGSGGSAKVTNASATPEKLVRGKRKQLNPMEEGFKKQRVALQELLSFLKRLPDDLRPLDNESVSRNAVRKCLKCGSVSHLPVVASRKRSSTKICLRSHGRRESPNIVARINSEVKRLRRTVQSVLAATKTI